MIFLHFILNESLRSIFFWLAFSKIHFLALGEIQRGNTGFIPFSFIEPKLKELLIDFGPPRKTLDPSYPFIRLANDQLWQFNKPEIINTNQDYYKKFILEHDLKGKVPDVFISAIQQLTHHSK